MLSVLTNIDTYWWQNGNKKWNGDRVNQLEVWLRTCTLKGAIMLIINFKHKGATVLYKPVDGAGTSFCIIFNMLHIRDTFYQN